MAILKCKMCGGTLEIMESTSVCECEYCGSMQTIPKLDDESRLNLYDRANHFRRNNEYDKAMGIYERILNEDPTDAEAYWSLVLCQYGIEYVEDPATHKRIPTVNRAQYTSIFADENYKAAIANADISQKSVYENEAKAIDEIQKGILEISSKEEPFDVFICYKETDNTGRRTPDSVLANDLYHQLTQEGFKVFFSRITLEDKLGVAYEPYIFAALNSARAMVVLGTKPEYFNAVWVKNEWSRYLALIKRGAKKVLIPAYKDMDPYDLPEEFSHLQAQDMSKLGFMQDLIRGIKKIIGDVKPISAQKESIVFQSQPSSNISALLKRGNMALEDGEWNKADGFFEEVLNQDAECAEAYIGKLLAQGRSTSFANWIAIQKMKYVNGTSETLEACPEDREHVEKIAKEYAIEGFLDEDNIMKLFEYNRGYESMLSCRIGQRVKQERELFSERLLNRAKQYASEDMLQQISNSIEEVLEVLTKRIEEAKTQDRISVDRVTKEYREHIRKADEKAETMNMEAQSRRDKRYEFTLSSMESANSIASYERTRDAFLSMNGYKESNELASRCQKEITCIQEKEKKNEEKEAERKAKSRKTIISIIAGVVVACIAGYFITTKVIGPNNDYKEAVELMEKGAYSVASERFKALNGYKDSEKLVVECNIEAVKVAKVGQTVVFGTYEQDNDTSNGREDIEWIILKTDDAKALVVSKYVLDCQKYNTSYMDVTWESCSLRTWLNKTFLQDAFSPEEVAYISTATVSADKNPKYKTDPGNDTQDKVFLLSAVEAEKLLLVRYCETTEFALSQGALVGIESDTSFWWLRTPGSDNCSTAYVNNIGAIYYGGDELDMNSDVLITSNRVDDETFGVRPALWINLES